MLLFYTPFSELNNNVSKKERHARMRWENYTTKIKFGKENIKLYFALFGFYWVTFVLVRLSLLNDYFNDT